MDYHVLSNQELVMILFYGGFSLAIFWALGGYLAIRDASPKQSKKGFARKCLPWIVLLMFLSEITVLVSRIVDYPWNVAPLPSQASAFRELRYMGTDYPLFGWANDSQQSLLLSLTGSIMWLYWTIYAFNFKPSETTWWKKTCKILAYIIISATILGFNIHGLGDLWVYFGIILFIVILLKIAKVRPTIKATTNQSKENINVDEHSIAISKPDKSEDSTLYIIEHPNAELQTQQPVIPVISSEPETIESLIKEGVENKFQTIEEIDMIKTSCSQKDDKNVVIGNENIEMMYCKHCGKRIEADSTFCKYCSKRVK